MVLPIVKYPSPILKKKAAPIIKVADDIRKLLDDMAETMYAAAGVGLAAQQVGISKRIIVVDVGIELPDGTKRSNLIKMINPEITWSGGEIEWEEGCLSIPEFTIKMKRRAKVIAKGLDQNGRPMEIIGEGLLAVALQHEIDHLDGKLLIDKVNKAEQKEYLAKVTKQSSKSKAQSSNE